MLFFSSRCALGLLSLCTAARERERESREAVTSARRERTARKRERETVPKKTNEMSERERGERATTFCSCKSEGEFFLLFVLLLTFFRLSVSLSLSCVTSKVLIFSLSLSL